MLKSRRYFEHNLNSLNEKFRSNEIQINNKLTKAIRGIENARIAPNHRANLHTINESARLMANTTNMMNEKKDIDK